MLTTDLTQSTPSASARTPSTPSTPSTPKASRLPGWALAGAALVALAAGCGAPEEDTDTATAQDSLTATTMWVGAHVGEPDNSEEAFLSVSSKFGPFRVRRSFNKNLPSDIQHSAAADDARNHVISFLSVKPPTIGGVAKGLYDNDIKTLAASFPTDHTTYLTMYHEPENDMTGPQFVALFRHFYTKVKAANPHIKVGTVHMSYQWRPGSSTTAEEDSWWVGSAYTDFIGVDDYNEKTTSGRTTAASDPQFQRWFNWAKTKGKPLAVVEFGRMENPNDASARANDLLNTETFLRNNNFFMFLYWHSTGPLNGGTVDWGLKSGPTATAMRTIAARGRTGW